MPSQLVTYRSPQDLAALIDDQTEHMLGLKATAKRNPYPRLRARTSHKKIVRHRRRPVAVNHDVDPKFIYPVQVTVGKEQSMTRRIYNTFPHDVKVLNPELEGTLWCPGYIFLAFDHPISDIEISDFKGLTAGFLSTDHLPAKDKFKILILSATF